MGWKVGTDGGNIGSKGSMKCKSMAGQVGRAVRGFELWRD